MECVICNRHGPADPGSKVEPGATKPIPGIFLMKDETPRWYLCGKCLQELRRLPKKDFVIILQAIRSIQRWKKVKSKGIMR